jgi:hypothetical protein
MADKENTIREIPDEDSLKATFATQKPDLFINTGKFPGKRFLVTINAGDKPTLIAIHL